MRRMLFALALLFLPCWSAEADQPTGVAFSTGYQSFWFSPSDDDVDIVRVNNGAIAPFYTADMGNTHYFRVGGEMNGADTGLLFLNWGWDISSDVAAFVGPSVRIINDGALEGFSGDTFAIGLNGSVDMVASVSEQRMQEVVSVFWGVEYTTRELVHGASGRGMKGLTVALGIDLASAIFEKKEAGP